MSCGWASQGSENFPSSKSVGTLVPLLCGVTQLDEYFFGLYHAHHAHIYISPKAPFPQWSPDPPPLPAALFVPWKMIYASRKRTWVQVRWEASIMLQLIRTNCRTKCNVPGNNGFRALYANLECHKCNQLIKRTARWQRMSSFVSPTSPPPSLVCLISCLIASLLCGGKCERVAGSSLAALAIPRITEIAARRK